MLQNELIHKHERAIKLLQDINRLELQIIDLTTRTDFELKKPHLDSFLLNSPKWYAEQIHGGREGIEDLKKEYESLKFTINGNR